MALTSEIKIVQEWYAALAERDMDKLVALVHEDVEIAASYQVNTGVQALREKYGKSHFNLIPVDFFYQENLIVVEEKQEWVSPETGKVIYTHFPATFFVVMDGLISRISPHLSLDYALQATDLETIYRVEGNDEKVIELRFASSWKTTEQSFIRLSSNPNWGHLNAVTNLMTELSKRGYKRKFRTGQSMDTFILSRSREYGLRIEQPSLNFVVNPDRSAEIFYWDGSNKINLYLERVELTAEVVELLERLAAQPID